MVVEMETTGNQAVARIEVQNLNKGKLAFETRVTRVDFDQDGEPTEKPADEDFLVFPPQGIIPVGGRQVVRLQWVGAPDIKASQAYYVAINQLPVALSPEEQAAGGAQVQIIYHMKALVVVAPNGAKPNVEAVSAYATDVAPPESTKGENPPARIPGVAITLKNTGDRYAMMAGMKWLLEGKGPDGKDVRWLLTPEDLNKTIGTGYVGPLGGTRTFRIPLATQFGPGPIKVKFIQ